MFQSQVFCPGWKASGKSTDVLSGATDTQGDWHTGFVHPPQGSNFSSHFLTLSLSYFLFIFHSVTSVPFTLSPFLCHTTHPKRHPCLPRTQTLGFYGYLPATTDELQCSENTKRCTYQCTHISVAIYVVDFRNCMYYLMLNTNIKSYTIWT